MVLSPLAKPRRQNERQNMRRKGNREIDTRPPLQTFVDFQSLAFRQAGRVKLGVICCCLANFLLRLRHPKKLGNGPSLVPQAALSMDIPFTMNRSTKA
jgi:hypothetical protein